MKTTYNHNENLLKQLLYTSCLIDGWHIWFVQREKFHVQNFDICVRTKTNCTQYNHKILKLAKNNGFSQEMRVLMQKRSKKKATNQTVPIFENSFDYSIGFDCSISMHIVEQLL